MSQSKPSNSVSFGRAFLDLSVIFGALAAVIVMAAFMGSSQPAQAAIMGPRPTVELVKVFTCWEGSHSYNSCPVTLEIEVNVWLQEIQPHGRIVGRTLAASQSQFVLVIFYEVPEWRTDKKPPEKKLPAEKP